MRAATKIAEPLFDASPAYDANCISCSEPMTVSVTALETCKLANHVLKRMGEKLMSKAEIAMCRGCYLKHHESMWAKERAKSDGFVRAWNAFKAVYRNAKDDDQREMFEKKLRIGMGDYWPSYSALFTAWKAELQTKKSKGTGASTAKAGF